MESKDSKNDIFKDMEEDIYKSSLSDKEKHKILKNILKLKEEKINIMITGATGCGKSSTINALFNTQIAKVGSGVDPETMEISKYDLDNLVLWDSPGLGDGKEADIKHSKNIIKKLNECDEDGNALIDLVLVILDGSSRDLGTSYELINQVIIPNLGKNLGKNKKNRILIAINQCDMAMKGRNWNGEENRPKEPLIKFLDEKVQSVSRRIKEGTGVDITPIYYSAGFKDEYDEQRPYNLSKLLYFIIKHTPKEKRLSYVNNISQNDDVWKDNDDLKDYSTEIKQSFAETVSEFASNGADIGEEMLGKVFGSTGEMIGRAVGGAVGAVAGTGKAIWNAITSW
ncbi:GTPase family protein [Clostridium tarantellae]|uniref:GTP-binding protein n=1 Tax=Clostridium tarantellae TaxID=39493 RepID=A0A6I1MMY1_9CLOT|nr:GTPase [Clostridium tarantellae]MPQ43828.1 GTP-binding protein [Clostridium tarantellae]